MGKILKKFQHTLCIRRIFEKVQNSRAGAVEFICALKRFISMCVTVEFFFPPGANYFLWKEVKLDFYPQNALQKKMNLFTS